MPWPDVIYHREALSFERPWRGGRWGAPQRRAAAQHVHDTLELIWNEAPMTLLLHGKRMVLEMPTVVILPPFATHIAEFVGTYDRKKIIGCHLAFYEPALNPTPNVLPLREGPLAPKHSEMVLPILEYLRRRHAEDPRANASLDLKLVAQGVLGLLRTLGYTGPPRREKNFRFIQKSLEVLYARYGDPELCVDDLANAANLSPAQFRRVFRKVTGQAPLDYLARHRLEQARMLLGHDVITVEAVARKVGFKSPSSLYKRYSKAFGVRPRQDRPGESPNEQ